MVKDAIQPEMWTPLNEFGLALTIDEVIEDLAELRTELGNLEQESAKHIAINHNGQEQSKCHSCKTFKTGIEAKKQLIKKLNDYLARLK